MLTVRAFHYPIITVCLLPNNTKNERMRNLHSKTEFEFLKKIQTNRIYVVSNQLITYSEFLLSEATPHDNFDDSTTQWRLMDCIDGCPQNEPHPIRCVTQIQNRY